MDERSRFIDAYLSGAFTMTELCERFQVSRRTGYKWWTRFQADGRSGLTDRSRAPHHCPHRIEADIAELLVRTRKKHHDWGPQKLIHYLAPKHPHIVWPALSTIGDLLKRRDLVKPRRRRYRPLHPGVVPIRTDHPNDLWTIDFKGHFRTGDGRYCYPLTVADLHSRYLLACQGLRSTEGEGVFPILERLFREHGLPRAIRSDNGVPFATTGLHGLSRLSTWWLRLGIQHQRIAPSSPQQNGAHERMHKTLKRGACRPARGSLSAQQRAFNQFRALYNEVRPHASLEGATPSSRYASSPRPYPDPLPPIEYPGHFVVRTITEAGTFRFKERILFLSHALTHHPIGLEETDDGWWSVYFCHVLLGRLDERTETLHRG